MLRHSGAPRLCQRSLFSKAFLRSFASVALTTRLVAPVPSSAAGPFLSVQRRYQSTNGNGTGTTQTEPASSPPDHLKAPTGNADAPAQTATDGSAPPAVADTYELTNQSQSSGIVMPDLSAFPPPRDDTKGAPNMVLNIAPTHPDAGGNYFPINESTSTKSVDRRDSKLYTMQEYVEKQQQEEFSGKKVTEELLDATDHPKWLLWSLLFMAGGSGYVIMCVRLRTERTRFDPKLRAVHSLDVEGGPTVGGPFELEDLDGNKVTNKTFEGKWIYIYFGFTHCPDVCPQEMAKMTRLISSLDKKIGAEKWQPLFISIDPKRDTKEVLKEYLSEFHPRIMGLTGTTEQIEKAAREYRVYYAVPDEFGTSPDYLIDHSIIMYLMDPEGKFCDYTTKEFTWFESYSKILRRVIDFERGKNTDAADFDPAIANLHSFSSNTDMERMKKFAAGDSKA